MVIKYFFNGTLSEQVYGYNSTPDVDLVDATIDVKLSAAMLVVGSVLIFVNMCVVISFALLLNKFKRKKVSHSAVMLVVVM